MKKALPLIFIITILPQLSLASENGLSCLQKLFGEKSYLCYQYVRERNSDHFKHIYYRASFKLHNNYLQEVDPDPQDNQNRKNSISYFLGSNQKVKRRYSNQRDVEDVTSRWSCDLQNKEIKVRVSHLSRKTSIETYNFTGNRFSSSHEDGNYKQSTKCSKD